MVTKDVVNGLKAIHGKETKRIFSEKLHAAWAKQPNSLNDFRFMVTHVVISMGLQLAEPLSNNTANAVAGKLDR